MLVQDCYYNGTTSIDLALGQSLKLVNSSATIFVITEGTITISANGRLVPASAPGLVVINDAGDIAIECQRPAKLQYYDTDISNDGNLPIGVNFAVDIATVTYAAQLSGGSIELGRAGELMLYLAPVGKMVSRDNWPFYVELDERFVLYAEAESANEPLLPEYDVVIIGAGTTGASMAAHSISAGLRTLVLGEPLSFWKRSILPLPLRSPMPATDIASPRDGMRYLDFANRHGLPTEGKIEFRYFVAYFHEFLLKHDITIVNKYVSNVKYAGGHWLVDIENGETVRTKNVVIAAGLGKMKRIPEASAELPTGSCIHASEINSIVAFKGQNIAVVGGGQSAIEMATELAKLAVNVHLLIRGEEIVYRSLHSPGISLFKFLFSNAEKYFKYTPKLLKKRILRFLLKGTVEPDLKAALAGRNIIVHNQAGISRASSTGGKVTLSLHGGQSIIVDRVILGSGYQYDVSKIPFLQSLLDDGWMDREDGFPVLDEAMQTTMAGLFFTGYPCIKVIGPRAQFISGTSIISPRITKEALARVSDI